MPLLPDPTPTQAIEQVLLAARLSDVPAERITLLRSAISAIDEKAAQLPKDWARQTRASAQATLDAELTIERRYAELSRATVAQATAAAAAGRRARRREGGRRRCRPATARSAGSGRTRWPACWPCSRSGWIRPGASACCATSGRARPRRFARTRPRSRGPIDRLVEARAEARGRQVARGPRRLVAARPDAELRARLPPARAHHAARRTWSAAHATLQSAAELGQQAMRTRERAAVQGDVATAWDASSAAAGSIMMLAQARRQIDARHASAGTPVNTPAHDPARSRRRPARPPRRARPRSPAAAPSPTCGAASSSCRRGPPAYLLRQTLEDLRFGDVPACRGRGARAARPPDSGRLVPAHARARGHSRSAASRRSSARSSWAPRRATRSTRAPCRRSACARD